MKLLVSGLVACMALSVPTTGQAQGLRQEEPDPQELEAERRFKTGIQLLREGRYRNAVTAFEKALPFKRNTSDIFYNLVQATRQTEQWDRLVLYAQGFLFRERESRDARAVERLMDQTFALLAGWRRHPAVVRFELAPAGTEVMVNGVPLTAGQGEVRLMPGRYVISAERMDFVGWSETIEIKAGEIKAGMPLRTVRATLVERIYQTHVRVATTPRDGVQVFVDDRLVGVTPIDDIAIDTGRRYLFRFEKDGYDSWVRYVTPRKDEVHELRPKLERELMARETRGTPEYRGLRFP
jgi:hypothetical protein